MPGLGNPKIGIAGECRQQGGQAGGVASRGWVSATDRVAPLAIVHLSSPAHGHIAGHSHGACRRHAKADHVSGQNGDKEQVAKCPHCGNVEFPISLVDGQFVAPVLSAARPLAAFLPRIRYSTELDHEVVTGEGR